MLQSLNKIMHNPVELVVGMCVLLVAAAGGAVLDLASTALAVLFITSLFYVRHWRAYWCSLGRIEQYLCIGFVLYVISGLLSYINVEDSTEFIKQFGRYLRFVLIIPVYLMIRAKNLDVSRYLITGVVLSGFIYFGFALHDVGLGFPASGQYHHITFANAIMLNVGTMGLLLLMPGKKWPYRLLVAASLLCGLYAVIMSGSRGAWMALPAYLAIYIVYAGTRNKSTVVKLMIAALVIVILIPLTPAKEIINKRYDAGVSDLTLFANDADYNTALGTRLSLWYIGLNVWMEHPILGTGLGDFDNDMVRYQAMGVYPGVLVFASTHNIYLQGLAGAGLLGLIALCNALIFTPLIEFTRLANREKLFARIGVVLVVSYAVFGLSESWILRAPVVSLYAIYLVSVFSLVVSNPAEKKI